MELNRSTRVRLRFKFDYLSERFEVQIQDLTEIEQDFCGFGPGKWRKRSDRISALSRESGDGTSASWRCNLIVS